jgi:hypothetical protein
VTTRHLRMSIKGALMRTDRELQIDLGDAITTDHGTVLHTGREIRAALLDELGKGRLYLPMGDCEGFDYTKGCPGHALPDEEQVS